MKLQTSDTIIVITGKDKGKTGKILRVLPDTERVIVEGVNMRTRHIRKTPQRPGQIIRYEASIHISNVMLLDLKTKKRARIGYQINDGKKVRISKRSGEVIERGARGAKIMKKEKTTKEKEMLKAPTKKPFWKRLGFGADALEEADAEEPSHTEAAHSGRSRSTKEDHSVPSDGRLQSSRSHGRGS